MLINAERDLEIAKPEEIEGWVKFEFPGRGEKYSAMRYHSEHFTGVDWDEFRQRSAIYKTVGPDKGWAEDVSHENGNYDYLMFANLDYSHPEVQMDVLNWGEWIGTELPLSGMRLDALKHFSAAFQKRFIDHMRKVYGPEYFFVGEYWSSDVTVMVDYLKSMDFSLSLVDAPLVGRMSGISRARRGDLRILFDNTLVKNEPEHAVVSYFSRNLMILVLIQLHSDIRHEP